MDIRQVPSLGRTYAALRSQLATGRRAGGQGLGFTRRRRRRWQRRNQNASLGPLAGAKTDLTHSGSRAAKSPPLELDQRPRNNHPPTFLGGTPINPFWRPEQAKRQAQWSQGCVA